MGKQRPVALVTNDDGIGSPLLRALVVELTKGFTVFVAAPEVEQSWIGRALSRRTEVSVRASEEAGAAGWAITGTPTDCVNLAMDHLLDELPDIVVSGLNIGYNTTLPMLLSSGTLAGALEGAHWGLPALAVSQKLARDDFLALQADRETLPARLRAVVAASAKHATQAALRMVATEARPRDFIVDNLNYPEGMSAETPVRHTVPAEVPARGLFQPTEKSTYGFAYSLGKARENSLPTDRETVEAGLVSWSRLNFSILSRSIQLPVSTFSPTDH